EYARCCRSEFFRSYQSFLNIGGHSRMIKCCVTVCWHCRSGCTNRVPQGRILFPTRFGIHPVLGIDVALEPPWPHFVPDELRHSPRPEDRWVYGEFVKPLRQ